MICALGKSPSVIRGAALSPESAGSLGKTREEEGRGGGVTRMPDEKYMKRALCLARQAQALNEVPVGCVIVGRDGTILGEGFNRRETGKNALSHAEMEAISAACGKTGDWRLSDCTMYVTLEPCPMCAGAIINARIPVLVYGAKDRISGACSSVINLFEENFGHKPAVYAGMLGRECGELLSAFFSTLRKG